MKREMLRVLQRVADLLIGNFAATFQNELRFMVRMRRFRSRIIFSCSADHVLMGRVKLPVRLVRKR